MKVKKSIQNGGVLYYGFGGLTNPGFKWLPDKTGTVQGETYWLYL